MKKLLVLFAVTSLLLITCGLLEEGTTSGNFWAQNYTTSEFYKVDAQLLAENARCKVWAEKGSGVTDATAKKIADEYASVIYVKNMNTFGYQINDSKLGILNTMEIAHYLATGKTKNAKLTILLLDIKDGYKTEDDPFVAGYFSPVDFFKNDPAHPEEKVKSNELDMIYIDTYPSEPDSFSTFETLAHEMQHLMNFVSSLLFRSDDENLILMDTWIDEGLSAAAEWVYSGQYPEIRWKYYNKDPSGLISKGNNFYIWDNHDDESPLANLDDYSTVYLFFQYLRLQAADPKKIYYDIHTSEFPDYQAVTNAEDINSSHKKNWPLLLRDWHAANYTNAASGLYGYKNDSVLKDIKAPMFSESVTSLDLFPGEGVYSKTSTAESVPASSGNIKYSGLSSSGSAPNDTTGFANGARLTYNVDTDKKGSSATGSTTGIAPSADVLLPGGSRSAQASDLTKFKGPFKVDAGYFSRRNGNSARNTAGNSTVSDKNITSLYGKSRSVNNGDNMLKIDTSTVERVFINE